MASVTSGEMDREEFFFLQLTSDPLPDIINEQSSLVLYM